MLSITQKAIKMFVEGKHKSGEKVTVVDISHAFNRHPDMIRDDLKAIRKDRHHFGSFIEEMGLGDIFKK
jgi:hypothetical protein